jgi:HTH-type transcriptional regulator, sugar sensing transcriptional regulator
MENASLDVLYSAGLNEHQAMVYNCLLQGGLLPARSLSSKASLSRPLTYKILDELIQVGLVEKDDKPGAVARFAPAHPFKLKELADKRVEAMQDARNALENGLGKFISDYNLVLGKPGIRLYEGLDGMQQVLDDTLLAKETIYSYADLTMIEKHMGDMNRAYVAKRERLGIKKQALLPDTQENRFLLEGYHIKITDVKLIDIHAAPFGTVMQIYDGKISYFTLGLAHIIGIVIADHNIYDMHKALFTRLWESPLAKTLEV